MGEEQSLNRFFPYLWRIWDWAVYYFCKGNTTIAIIIVALIIIFLWREGVDFFPEHRRHLQLYRSAGGEAVDRALMPLNVAQDLINDWNDFFQSTRRIQSGEGQERLDNLHTAWIRFGDRIYEARLKAELLVRHVMSIRQKIKVAEDQGKRKAVLVKIGKLSEAAQIRIDRVDFLAEEKRLRDLLSTYQSVIEDFKAELQGLWRGYQLWVTGDGRNLARKAELKKITKEFEKIEKMCIAWSVEIDQIDFHSEVSLWDSFWAFMMGRDWVTQSFWMDWYGLLPILTGSALVCCLALMLAVPLGVGAAIYVSEFASKQERELIKPALEFIAAIPSVVLGFIGIAVLGESLQDFSQLEWMRWVPGFPIAERLNVLTAGCLLAFMAVPTIFSLTEDAIQNVPQAYKQGSFALGATKMQTMFHIILPTALSGITAAVLLGMGRVIGETMVVLLCAGNRMQLPEFGSGLAVFTQPVHTMTGIIAQEIPEVVRGSLQYRALFVIGIVLFLIALVINFSVQYLLRKFQRKG